MEEPKFKPDREGIRSAIEATPDIMGWWEDKVDWFYIEPELNAGDKLAVFATYLTMKTDRSSFTPEQQVIINDLIKLILGENYEITIT